MDAFYIINKRNCEKDFFIHSSAVYVKGGLFVEPVNAIELIGVTKRFGEVVANDNVNLTVRKGEILSILGENGSGKLR